MVNATGSIQTYSWKSSRGLSSSSALSPNEWRACFAANSLATPVTGFLTVDGFTGFPFLACCVAWVLLFSAFVVSTKTEVRAITSNRDGIAFTTIRSLSPMHMPRIEEVFAPWSGIASVNLDGPEINEGGYCVRIDLTDPDPLGDSVMLDLTPDEAPAIALYQGLLSSRAQQLTRTAAL